VDLSVWSVWRVLALWASWLFVVSTTLVVTIAVFVRRMRERIPVAGPGETGVMNGFAIPISPSVLRLVVILSVMPPALVTALWIWRRFGARR
jgi:hypothetical protein